MAGPPGPPGNAPSFSPQAMMMMFQPPSSGSKGYMGDDPNVYKDSLTEVTKVVDCKSVHMSTLISARRSYGQAAVMSVSCGAPIRRLLKAVVFL